MSNLRKPIFWAVVLIEIYILMLLTFVIASASFSFWVKFLFSVMVIVLITRAVISFRRPISDKPVVGITCLMLSFVLIVGGSRGVVMLASQQYDYNELELFALGPMIFATMLPFGILACVLSIIGLMTNRKPKKSAGNSSSHLNP